MKAVLNPVTGSLIRHRRDTDTEEKPRGDGGRDGREAATSPGTDARSPRSWKRRGGHHDPRHLFSRTRGGSEGR